MFSRDGEYMQPRAKPCIMHFSPPRSRCVSEVLERWLGTAGFHCAADREPPRRWYTWLTRQEGLPSSASHHVEYEIHQPFMQNSLFIISNLRSRDLLFIYQCAESDGSGCRRRSTGRSLLRRLFPGLKPLPLLRLCRREIVTILAGFSTVCYAVVAPHEVGGTGSM